MFYLFLGFNAFKPFDKAIERIVGGEEADAGQFPFQASLQLYGGEILGWQHFCGAIILDENTVMTAAHCNIMNITALAETRVSAGFLTLLDNDEEPYKQDRDMAEFIEHPDFIIDQLTGYIRNDIALLRVASPFDLTSNPEQIAAAEFPTTSTSFPIYDKENSCFVSGWGTIRYGLLELPNNEMLWANITAFPDDYCLSAWGDFTFDGTQMICAGAPEGGRGACSGDSGGPLFCEGDDGIFRVYGVTSFGDISCGEDPRFPEVWTEIAPYVDWIKKTQLAFKH